MDYDALVQALEQAVEDSDDRALREWIHPASFREDASLTRIYLRKYVDAAAENAPAVDWSLAYRILPEQEKLFVDPSTTVSAYIKAGQLRLLPVRPDDFLEITFSTAAGDQPLDVLPVTGSGGDARIVLEEYAEALSDSQLDSWIERANRLRQGQSIEGLEAIPIHRAEPRYPRTAALSKTQGCATVVFQIDADGVPTDIRVAESYPGNVFAKVSREAISKWRFLPGSEGEMSQIIKYQLAGEEAETDPQYREHCMDDESASQAIGSDHTGGNFTRLSP